MTKDDLLLSIAEAGYNVGFGAKKHFATHDIVAKVPGVIGFVSTAVGIFSLVMDALSTKQLSAAFIVLGVGGLSVGKYNHKKEQYAEAGQNLTELFGRLKSLYRTVKNATDDELGKYERALNKIEQEYQPLCISDQVLFSDWYAHYKFFWQHQIEWIDEQKQFSLWKDKLPLTIVVLFTASIACSTCWLIYCWCCSG